MPQDAAKDEEDEGDDYGGADRGRRDLDDYYAGAVGRSPVVAVPPPSTLPQRVAPGTVYFVATPLGNLEDVTLRAMRVLREADVVAAEDTRRAGKLLQLLGIETAAASARQRGSGRGGPVLLSHHEHNAKQRVPDLVRRAQAGQVVAVVSDAGTPGIADPGALLAAACATAGVPVEPVPGPCALVAALSVSGFPCAEFIFLGFLPRRGAALERKVAAMAADPRPAIFYEAPHRITFTLAALLASGQGSRRVLVARELTKLHEEAFRGTVAEAVAWLDSKPPRGEFTVVLAGQGSGGGNDNSGGSDTTSDAGSGSGRLAAALVHARALVASKGVPLSGAVRSAAKEHGLRKADLYRLAVGPHAQVD